MAFRQSGSAGNQILVPSLLQLSRVVKHRDRVEIIQRLGLKEHTVSELAKALDLAPCDISKHLGNLYDHGVVNFTKRGQKHVYRVAACVRLRQEEQELLVTIQTDEGLEMTLRGACPRGTAVAAPSALPSEPADIAQ